MTAKRFFHARVLQALCLLALSTGFSLSSALADTLAVKGDAPQSYTVVKGDTLWDISGKYLEKPWRWPELWEGNPQIVNPHLIYPGDIISLYYVDGQPRLGINRARGTVKLSPKIRATRIEQAIPVIPIDAIQQFLHKLRILDKASFDKAPYVVRGQESRIITAQGDRIYVKGKLPSSDSKEYQIYHMGSPVKDPSSDKVIGYEGIFVGDAKLDRKGEPSTLLMTSSKREVSVGDRALVRESDHALTNFKPRVPDNNVSGQVLNVVDGIKVFGQFQAVIINLGSADGLSRGHVLSSFAPGETVPDTVTDDRKDTVKLPDERSGTLMVIKAFENLSYAMVMESRLPVHVLDEVRTPE